MLRELAEGVYYEDEFEGGNVGLIVSDKGGVLVDTPMLPTDARRWQLTLMQMGVDPVYAVVNTDYHPEHFLGNHFYMPTRTFGNEASEKPISKYESSTLEQIANRYKDRDPALAEEILRIEIHPPELNVHDRVTLHLGNRKAQVLFLPGHTPASLGLYLPEERILFAGDNIVNNEHPVMRDASSKEWLDTLKKIEAMDIDVIVPGVGDPCGKEVIPPLYDYIVEMRYRSAKYWHAGSSRRETVDKVGMLDWYPVPEDQATRIKRRRRESVEQVYTEIRVANRRRTRRRRRRRR